MQCIVVIQLSRDSHIRMGEANANQQENIIGVTC
jgi:hypothetical protein